MKKPQQQRMIISLGLALLIHALLLLIFTAEKQSLLVIEFAQVPPSMSVTLDAINIAATVMRTDARLKKAKIKHNNDIHTRIKPQNRKSQNRRPQSREAKTNLSAKPDILTPSNEHLPRNSLVKLPDSREQKNISAMNRAKLISRLSKELKEQYFIYPLIAQRNNIQGTVLLGFGIKQTGLIHDIHIIKSSGHAILDLAAEQSIQQLHQVSWTKGMFAQTNITLELPVIYKLLE